VQPPQKEALLDSNNYLPSSQEVQVINNGDMNASGYNVNRTKLINTEVSEKKLTSASYNPE
jgi:hypothetical protein